MTTNFASRQHPYRLNDEGYDMDERRRLMNAGIVSQRTPRFVNAGEPWSSDQLARAGFPFAAEARRATEQAHYGLDGYR